MAPSPPNLPVSLGEVASALIAGKIYVIGQNSAVTYIFDTNSWSWSTGKSRPLPGNHHAVVVPSDQNMWVVGGFGGGSEGMVRDILLHISLIQRFKCTIRVPTAGLLEHRFLQSLGAQWWRWWRRMWSTSAEASLRRERSQIVASTTSNRRAFLPCPACHVGSTMLPSPQMATTSTCLVAGAFFALEDP